MPTDYRPTVFLPKTDFPMRGDLPKREPLMLARWTEMDLYGGCANWPPGAKNLCCMTARPTPTAISISAMR